MIERGTFLAQESSPSPPYTNQFQADPVSMLRPCGRGRARRASVGGNRDWKLPRERIGGEVEHAEVAKERERRREHVGEVEAPARSATEGARGVRVEREHGKNSEKRIRRWQPRKGIIDGGGIVITGAGDRPPPRPRPQPRLWPPLPSSSMGNLLRYGSRFLLARMLLITV